MHQLVQMLLIAAGGSLGAIARFWITQWSAARLDGGFPWGTLAANCSGCFLMGLLVGLGFNSEHRVYLLLGVGFLGSMTTFSAFGVETLDQAAQGRYLASGLNIVANVLGGLAAAGLGIAVVRLSDWAGPATPGG